MNTGIWENSPNLCIQETYNIFAPCIIKENLINDATNCLPILSTSFHISTIISVLNIAYEMMDICNSGEWFRWNFVFRAEWRTMKASRSNHPAQRNKHLKHCLFIYNLSFSSFSLLTYLLCSSWWLCMCYYH